jgi:dihydroorotase/N-acyl-D-amino-acid deacylase
MPETIARIDAARAAGIDVACDMYPYVAAGTGLATVLPPWAEADGRLWENVRDPASRERMKEEILNPTGAWENLGVSDGPENVVLAGLLLPSTGRTSGDPSPMWPASAASTGRTPRWICSPRSARTSSASTSR